MASRIRCMTLFTSNVAPSLSVARTVVGEFGFPTPGSHPEDIRAFHQLSLEAAGQFRSFYKDALGREPRPEMLNTPEQERAVSEWLQGPEGRERIQGIAERVISFVHASIGYGHPGHDKRHVLYKDPIAGLRLALEEDLSPYHELFILPSLLHDVGRLYEPALFARPQSGALGVDHAALGFSVTRHLLGEDLATESGRSDVSLALANLRNEILNAVLDHQCGDSRASFIAQAVQRADREQLVGYEMLHRSLAFDTGFHGLRLRSAVMSERCHTLPLPGSAHDTHLFHHIEFYMRNLFPNVGRAAHHHTDRGKVETGRFLWLAASPAMRAQIFAPEIARDEGRHSRTGKFKAPLDPPIWRAITEYPSPATMDELLRVRDGRSLRDLAHTFVHPRHATRTDTPGYENWGRIDTALTVLQPLEKRRMGDALSYGLKLADDVAQHDGRIINDALERFGGEPSSVLGTVARLMHELHGS